MAIKDIKASRVNNIEWNQYVGQAGQIFYNPNLGNLRLSDGITVGGVDLSGGGGTIPVTFETLSKNLNAYPFDITYDGSQISYIVYTLPSSDTIIKTLNYSGSLIESIEITGTGISGAIYTKILSYSGSTITGATYIVV